MTVSDYLPLRSYTFDNGYSFGSRELIAYRHEGTLYLVEYQFNQGYYDCLGSRGDTVQLCRIRVNGKPARVSRELRAAIKMAAMDDHFDRIRAYVRSSRATAAAARSQSQEGPSPPRPEA